MSGDGRRDQLEAVLSRLVGLSTAERLLVSLAAVVVAVLAGMVVILAAGAVAACETPAVSPLGVEVCYNPIEVYRVLLVGAFGDLFSLAETLQWTTILLFTGLSFAIAFKAGLFNIGAQGQFVLGSLATAVSILALAPHVPSGVLGRFVLVPAGLVSGTVVGAAYGYLPGYLKYRFDTNEVISTLLLNFIASAVAFVLVDRYFGDESIQGTVTERIPEAATFRPRLGVFPSGVDFSELVFVFGLVVVAGFLWLLRRTTIGYDIRAMGAQPKAAVFGGVSERFTTLFSFTLAGAVAGLGGAIYVMMVLGRWQTGVPPVGFDGIAVSILAGNNPVGLVPSGLLFGALESGNRAIEFQLGIPGELVEVLRGLIILFVATPELFRMLGVRLDRRGTVDLDRGGES